MTVYGADKVKAKQFKQLTDALNKFMNNKVRKARNVASQNVGKFGSYIYRAGNFEAKFNFVGDYRDLAEDFTDHLNGATEYCAYAEGSTVFIMVPWLDPNK